MKTILFISVILLAGCDVNITSEQIANAVKLCKNNNGLSYIKNVDNAEIKYVNCKNGAEFRTTE
jgi:hypothetical protein